MSTNTALLGIIAFSVAVAVFGRANTADPADDGLRNTFIALLIVAAIVAVGYLGSHEWGS